MHRLLTLEPLFWHCLLLFWSCSIAVPQAMASVGGCSHDIECDDGLPCTDDFCDLPANGPFGSGTCQHTPVPDGQPGGVGGQACARDFGLLCGGCDDGLFCNGPETCQSGVCAPGAPPCTGGEVCSESLDLCQPGPCSETKVCVGGPTPGTACATTSSCGVGGLCRYGDCHDGLHCNGEETCVAGVCQAGENPCGIGAFCGERQCNEGVQTDICITDEDCLADLGTCSLVGPVCIWGRCCIGTVEPTCNRRMPKGMCQGNTPGSNGLAACLTDSDCNNGLCQQLAGSCPGVGGIFFGGDLGTIPQGGGPACPVTNGVQMRCPKYGSGIAPHGPMVAPVGPVSHSSQSHPLAGSAIYKLGDDYVFSNPGFCAGGDRDGLSCATNNECPNGGVCNPSDTSVLAVSYLRIAGGFVGYTFLVVEFYDASGNFVAQSYAGNAGYAGLTRFFFDPPVIVPSRGFVVLRVAPEYSPDGRFFWHSTDAVDIGTNDPEVLWLNDGPIANFLTPNPGILAFEIEGQKVPAPLGACCDSDGVACTDGVLPWICTGQGNHFQGPGSTCPVPACETGACCGPVPGSCTVVSETDCTNGGGEFQGYGTDCDVDDGYDGGQQHCCPQPYTGADRCEDAIVHDIAVPPPGAPPVVVTISGDNSPATFQPDDYCCSDDCAFDYGWWEAFELDDYAYVRIDSCCTEPRLRFFRRALFDCPCGQAIMSAANPTRYGEPAHGRGDPYCDDENLWAHFGPLAPGRYYYQVASLEEANHGPYQLHITVEALPLAACCVADQCVDGVHQFECDDLGGVFLAPPQKAPLVADCSSNPCATGSCCVGPGQCFDDFLGQPVTPTDCLNIQATYFGGIRCSGGTCETQPGISCNQHADCPDNSICMGTPQQLEQPLPCPTCSVESPQRCQGFEDHFEFTISDRSLGFDGMLSADDFRPEGSSLERLCAWGFFLNTDPDAPHLDCHLTSGPDQFRVRVFANSSTTGRSPGTLVAESPATATRGEIPSPVISNRLQVSVFVFELTLQTPIVGLTPGATYWIEVSNDLSGVHPTCTWFWAQKVQTTISYSFKGNESGYPVHQSAPFDNVFCLDVAFSPLPEDALSAACCTCDGLCSLKTRFDCAKINGVWDSTHSTCDGVVCPVGPPPNDNCIDGPPLITTGVHIVNNQCATTDGWGPWAPFGVTPIDFDVWFYYVAPTACDLVVSECQTGQLFDSALAVYYNPENPTLCPPCPLDETTSAQHLAGISQDESCVGTAVGGAGHWRASEQILREALPGECFLIRVGGFPGQRGTAILDVVCPGAPTESPGPVLPETNAGCTAPGLPSACCTGSGVGTCDKSRFISFTPPADAVGAIALRVNLTSLHHVNPPYTAGPSIPFTAFEGSSLFVGPPEDFVESAANPTPFKSAALQCQPHYRDWSTVGLIHVRGSAIVPSSTYHVEVLAATCLGNEGTVPCQSGGFNVSNPIEIKTTRWADIEIPLNPPSPTAQPDLADVAALVNKFRSQPGAPSKARAMLAGTDAFGNLDLTSDLNFTHISVSVDAFRGRPYPYQMQTCP